MSRVQPGSGYRLPALPQRTNSGTDWILISSITLCIAAVMACMYGFILPRMMARAATARVGAATSDLNTLATAIRTFRLNCDRYPTNVEGLQALEVQPPNCKGWKGPYVSIPIPRDPWHHAYDYQYPASDNDQAFQLMSYGSDGVPGGEGQAADIVVEDQ